MRVAFPITPFWRHCDAITPSVEYEVDGLLYGGDGYHDTELTPMHEGVSGALIRLQRRRIAVILLSGVHAPQDVAAWAGDHGIWAVADDGKPRTRWTDHRRALCTDRRLPDTDKAGNQWTASNLPAHAAEVERELSGRR